MKKTIQNISSKESMARFAQELARRVATLSVLKHATVIALEGDLGAGKTTFTKAFLKALGVRESVTSPTFILFRPYVLRKSFKLQAISHQLPFQLAYHIDCYRLEDPKELLKLGLKEMLKNPKYIVIIEWAERVKKFLPKNLIWISIEHGAKKGSRMVRISGI